MQHTKVLGLCGQSWRIFIDGDCVTDVCEAERNWRKKTQAN